MNEEKTKNIILSIFIGLILVGSIFAVIYNIFPTVSDLRDNSALISDNEINKNQKKENTDSKIPSEENSLVNEMNINGDVVNEIKKEENAFSTEISTYSTTIYDTEENRMYNIGLATEKLNDIIIKKGEEFSFNNTIRPYGAR